jgi:DNA-binding transcriptional LysR family regulator
MTPSRLRQLEAFRAVMQSGSVSRAAQRMFLSQPAVTKLLRGLEDETGLPLFDRSRRHLQPTPEAIKLEADVATLFAAADHLDRTIDDMRGVGSGELRVAAMPLMGLSLIPRLLAKFAREVQPVRISLVVASSREVHDLVQAGNADLGFALPVGRSALVAAPPIDLPGLVVLPPGHRLTRNKAIPLSELHNEPYISLGRQYRLRDQVDELFTVNGVVPRLVAETQNAAAACAMVAAGLGFAVAEAVTVRSLRGQVIVRRLQPTVTFSVSILGSPGRPLSTAALSFLKLVRSDLAS